MVSLGVGVSRRLTAPPGCFRPAVGELCPALGLPALSHPGSVFWLPWAQGTAARASPGAGTSQPSHGWGGHPSLSPPHTAQPVPWSPEGRSLHPCVKWLVVCHRTLQILPKYPRLSSTSATTPMEPRYFCGDTLQSGCMWGNAVQGHICCVPHSTGGVPLLAAQSSLPGKWCTLPMGQGQMVKAKGLVALITVMQCLKCEITA